MRRLIAPGTDAVRFVLRRLIFSLLGCGAIAFAGILACTAVLAQPYPSKAIRSIIPFAPGGGNDIMARILAQKLSERWGYPVIVDNRPGAGGNIAAETVARSAPDGYTMLQFNAANTIAVSLYKKLSYDPVKDFAAVTQLTLAPSVLLVNTKVNARNVAELIALAKAQPGKLNYASSGSGGTSHLAMELLKSMAKIDVVHIPYNGAGPAMNSLLAGQVELLSTTPLASLPHVRSGRLRALGVSSKKRNTLLPEVPTVSESGVPGYESSSWYGIVVPAGTPPAVVLKLSSEIVRILREADVEQRLTSQGLDIVGSSPEQFAAFIKAEIAKWNHIVKISGAKVE